MLSLEFDQLKKKSLEIGHANATTKSLNQQHETTLIALRVDHQAISETVYCLNKKEIWACETTMPEITEYFY